MLLTIGLLLASATLGLAAPVQVDRDGIKQNAQRMGNAV